MDERIMGLEGYVLKSVSEIKARLDKLEEVVDNEKKKRRRIYDRYFKGIKGTGIQTRSDK